VSPELEREVSRIYHEHSAGLLRYAEAIARDGDDARDAVQECFLRYCLERRFGRTVENPRAWLFQVLRNFLLTRRAASKGELASDRLEHIADERGDPEAMASRTQRARAIREQLSRRELECLRLRAEGLSYTQIGAALAIRCGTVGALLSRAAEKLRWPPGREGTIGLGTAEAVYYLFLGGSTCVTPISER
jgi:RNA polymerase sigma-70 factor (ECF subfamily)